MSTKAEDADKESQKLTPDQKAAHEFLSELRTRITVQPLAYQHGVEATALESLWKVFGQAREAMKKNPGCEEFADLVTEMLNVEIRPMTAKWHRAGEEGRLNSRDGGDEFRAELSALQVKLQRYAGEFHVMAYGAAGTDRETRPALSKAAVDRCMASMRYGVPPGMLMDAEGCRNDLNTDEAAHIEARREHAGAVPGEGPAPAAGADAAGLALSGGGIRSASFSLGVVQVLAERGLLGQFDFLSTVSGGGYTGCFLTTRMGTGTPSADLGKPQGPDTLPVRCLRQRAKFLTARSLWESWGMVTATVAGLIVNWTVPLLLLTGMAIVVTLVGWRDLDAPFWGTATGWLAAGAGVASLVYFGALRSRTGRAPVSGWIFVILTILVTLAGIVWAMNGAFEWLFAKDGSVPRWESWPDFGSALAGAGGKFSVGLAGAGGLAALVPIVLRFVPVLKNPTVRKWVIKVALLVAGIVIPLLGAAVLLLLCAAGRVSPPGSPMLSGISLLIIATLVLLIIALWVLDINVTGPHRLYRNGLDKAFVQESEVADDITPVGLAGIDAGRRAPYHLINTAVNLPGGKRPGLRDRLCDFFLFSKHYCGSPVLGYRPTGEWQMSGRDVDIGTAMAISGAAFSSNMGLGSIASLRALLTFLNVRLGYWIRRPDMPGKWGLPPWKHPGFMCLLREMTGIGLDEDTRWVNLSDGGHIENMGVYELLRRRCKFIVCVDGECDPEFGFGGLMTAVRHAQIDFGIGIEPNIRQLKPDPATGCGQVHGMLTRIHYPAAGNHGEGFGLLLYLKLSMTGNEPELINRYRRVHPEFPHQTTLDQFFDEEQFEAYRQLGVHVAEGMFSRSLMHDPHSQQPVPDDPAATAGRKYAMQTWFRLLASNLLDPLPDDPAGNRAA